MRKKKVWPIKIAPIDKEMHTVDHLRDALADFPGDAKLRISIKATDKTAETSIHNATNINRIITMAYNEKANICYLAIVDSSQIFTKEERSNGI